MRRRRPSRARLYQSAPYRDLALLLASNIRRLRDVRGWTQEQAAEQCEIAPRMLQAIEAGDANITLVTIARLTVGLDVDASKLFARSRRR